MARLHLVLETLAVPERALALGVLLQRDATALLLELPGLTPTQPRPGATQGLRVVLSGH